MGTPPYTGNEIRFMSSPGTADVFLVYLRRDESVLVAVIPHDRPS